MTFLDRIRIRGAPRTEAEADLLALRQLESAGADLTKPRHVVHVLTFPRERDALDAADAVARGGYTTTVAPPEEASEPWSVRAETTRVVTTTTVEAYRSWFERVAAEHHGEYDGWEAARRP